MEAKEYCESVEQNYRRQQERLPTVLIRENNTRLVSLLDSGFKLIFEPSVKKNYKHKVREDVVGKIGRISRLLDKENKRLIIRSVWRSFDHQKLLWENEVRSCQKKYPNKHLEEIKKFVSYFIAPPSKSMHSTGGAVDALIYDLKNDSVMDFGTNDGLKINLNETCYPYHPHISSLAMKNRKLLINLFEEEDFVVDLKEYWHFDYGDAAWALDKGKDHAIYGIIKE